jgi:hypothetical protein
MQNFAVLLDPSEECVSGSRAKDSTVPAAGQGVLTTKAIKKKQPTVRYKGEQLTKAQLDARYPN